MKRLKQEDGQSLADASCGRFDNDIEPWQITRAAVLLPCATQNEVDEQLRDIMAAIHDRCIEHVGRNKAGIYPYSKGANLYGFRRLADAMVSFGLQ